MRFGKTFGQIAIPEWKECYLNYDILKIFIIIIKSSIETLENCDAAISIIESSKGTWLDREGLVPWYRQELISIQKEIWFTLEEANMNFYSIYVVQMEIVELFYQMKVLQIDDRYEVILRVASRQFTQKKFELFLTYVEYSYVEISYLTEMREANLQAERKILKKHKKNAKKFVHTPSSRHQKIIRMIRIEEDYAQKIQNLYVDLNKQMESKDAREYIRETAHKEESSQNQYFYMGIGVGVSLSVLGILIFIISYMGLSIQNNSVFARDFPTWRGIAIFILYIWVLAFDLYCFQKYKISHRLTFQFNDHHYSTSAQIFRLAGIFTAIFLACFLVYLLCISELFILVKPLRPQYLVLIIYFCLFGYMVAPLPIFNHMGRLYAFRLIVRSLTSPVTGVNFPIVWMTDQWQSLITPLRDVAYTICYYGRVDFDDPLDQTCSQASTFEVALLVVVIAVCYRIVQCMRLGYDNGYWCKPNMFNTIKYMLSLASALLAYASNHDPQLIIIWISLSVVTTMYSYFWDIKMDWNLLECSEKSTFLRKYITFGPKRNYYIVVVVNLLMRLAWTMTLSPAIIATFGDKNLLTLATGSIQIVRRGIWNLFRVQKQHLANCVQFKAIPDLKKLQDKLQQGMSTQTVTNVRNKQHVKNREIVKKQFVELLKNKLQWRQMDESSFTEEYERIELKKVEEHKERIKEILNFVQGINRKAYR